MSTKKQANLRITKPAVWPRETVKARYQRLDNLLREGGGNGNDVSEHIRLKQYLYP